MSTSIENWQSASSAKNDTTEEDALDAFMSSLSSFALTKSDIAKMKLELQNLRKEEASLIKLLNLTQPANLPALSYHDTTDQNISQAKTVAHLMQNAPVERKKIYNSLLCGKKVSKYLLCPHLICPQYSTIPLWNVHIGETNKAVCSYQY